MGRGESATATHLQHLVEPAKFGLELHAVEHAPLSHLEDVPQLLQVSFNRFLRSEGAKKAPSTKHQQKRSKTSQDETEMGKVCVWGGGGGGGVKEGSLSCFACLASKNQISITK